ncbi:MAG TPA: OmpH family outer membrane protein [Flavitalea sp.]|nr:OmpH family outer membrane protein [Flavitalea sp.]
MRNISTYLSILALIAVGFLYYLHFKGEKKSEARSSGNVHSGSSNFRMAYFDIDSLQEKYEYFKDVSGQMKQKEANLTSQMDALQNNYQKRLKELQEKGPTMTQSEGEAAQREVAQMQQKFQQRQMSMEQDLKKHQVDLMTDVRSKIENYLKEYNKEKGYAFILSYEPGFMLYYRDSLYDITKDVIRGLNEQYRNEKK